MQVGYQAITAMERVHTLRTYGLTFGWSVLVWLGTFAWFAAFLSAVELPTRYPLVVVGATFATLGNALPFPTIGGFGTQDAGWAFGFYFIGMARETAIVSGFAVNILTVLASGILGSVAFAYR